MSDGNRKKGKYPRAKLSGFRTRTMYTVLKITLTRNARPMMFHTKITGLFNLVLTKPK
jgi:hypothetical protein